EAPGGGLRGDQAGHSTVPGSPVAAHFADEGGEGFGPADGGLLQPGNRRGGGGANRGQAGSDALPRRRKAGDKNIFRFGRHRASNPEGRAALGLRRSVGAGARRRLPTADGAPSGRARRAASRQRHRPPSAALWDGTRRTTDKIRPPPRASPRQSR